MSDPIQEVREAFSDLLNCFWDMSPLEFAASKGMSSISDGTGEQVLEIARKALHSLQEKVIVDRKRLIFLAELVAHLFSLIEQNEENNKAKDKAQQLFELLLAETHLTKEGSDEQIKRLHSSEVS